MRCPHCCCGMQVMDKGEKYFVSWDYMLNAAKYFYGVDTIDISGGEPSIHPELEAWAHKLKELFGCRLLTMDTNGTMFKKKPEMFGHFNKIYVTHYVPGTFEGSPDNIEEINFLKDYYKDKPELLHVSGDMTHVDRARRGTKPCFRAYSGTVHYAGGRLYPCCVGPGLDTKISIPLTDNWKEEILKTQPPCHDCFLAED